MAADSTIAADESSLTMEWNVATQGRATIPRRYDPPEGQGGYEVKLLWMPTVNPRERQGDTATPLVPDIALKHCDDDEDYNPANVTTGLANTQAGIRIRTAATRGASSDDANNDRDYRVCVRANLSETRTGPWSIGTRILVKEASE